MSPIAFRQAKRGQSYVLLGLAGYTGTGKTFSALRLARGLAGDKPFAYIDTESNRALHYDWFAQPWDHGELDPPFTPERYLDAIKAAEQAGYPVIVVDSMSHEYSGVGGLQDMAEAERAKGLPDLAVWNKPKQAHRRFADDLTRVKAHLILCFRAREAIEMRKNPKTGKNEVVPVESIKGHPGWLIDTEQKNRPLPYELTLSILLIPRPEEERGHPIVVKIEDQHRQLVPLDKPLSEDTGVALAKWANLSDPGTAEQSARVLELVGQIDACAEQLGNRVAVNAAIAKNRRAHANDPAKHVEWLEATLAAAQSKLAETDQAADDDPFADLPPEEPASAEASA